MHLTPEQRAIGKENFNAALGSRPIRRDFLKKAVAAGIASGKGLGPMYFDYGKSVPEPVRVGVIGTGDEGCVLIGAINPDFVTVKSIADIRPYNIWRAFHGDHYSPTAAKVRPGLLSVYGWKDEKNVKVYKAYEELIENAKQDGIEAVIIALPLHLHAPAAIAAMRAGLHVLTEKLMAHSVHECKEMARVAQDSQFWPAKDQPLLLAVGHQRHYNILYEDAVEMISKGLLGDLHYIRAQWHRGNLPGHDSWQPPMPRAAKPNDPLADYLDKRLKSTKKNLDQLRVELKNLKPGDKKRGDVEKMIALAEIQIQQLDAQIADDVDAEKYDYRYLELKDAAGTVLYKRPATEELIRWRLWDRTGGGLMAELGSHQLDAASIFIAALHEGKKQLPLTVAASATRPLFPADRDVEDHVFCILDFPAPGYDDPKIPFSERKKIGVQYASINGNGFGGYGETVFGTTGTLLIDREEEALLYRTSDVTGKIKVVQSSDKKKPPELKIEEGGDPESAAFGALGTLPAVRGYTEEIEHWAWCIRNPGPENQPRCTAKVALGDAVIALTANQAARKNTRIAFQKEWFDPDRDETPEDVKPDVSRYET
ncbi:MAG: Gfo/Idh/MocA family oxidoreductase [Pirellulales bacterium]|nr:Gfo/Idh/MocA family oxidoreductase [Pirellulales bacterium]